MRIIVIATLTFFLGHLFGLVSWKIAAFQARYIILADIYQNYIIL